jgi:hypothetical protein
MRSWRVGMVCVAVCAVCPLTADASAAPSRPASAAGRASLDQTTSAPAPSQAPAANVPPAGAVSSENDMLTVADALPKVSAVRAKYKGSYGVAIFEPPSRWKVSYFLPAGKEIAQVFVDDQSWRVLEVWTGVQVRWVMARGSSHWAIGRHVNALWVWLPLCVLFIFPFIDFRRPFSLLHLDLLVLLSFSISLAFFNHAHIYASVPLTYPPLLYLLARMLALSRPGSRRQKRPLRLNVRPSWLAVGAVLLLGFRIALNVVDPEVLDIGYAGVMGAQRIVQGKPLYGGWPAENPHGDTYGPVKFEAYVPFVQVFGWSGTWDDLPAAHAAAIVFDLLAVALLFLLGRRVRGPTLAIALAYAWLAYPFTLYALDNNVDDTLVAVLILAALLVSRSAPARGVFAALAGLTKFLPLALVPLLATYGLWGDAGDGGSPGPGHEQSVARGKRLRIRRLAQFFAAFALTCAVVSIPALSHDSLHTIYESTVVFQEGRGSPFSVWGLYGGLGGLQLVVQIAAIVLALVLALIPRPRDLVALAAACAAVIIAVQLGLEHWFYLYIPWFAGLALLAMLGSLSPSPSARTASPSEPARLSRPAAVLSSG